MSRRGRLAIAAQAVAVAVLVAIVYSTLLQPDDGGNLSGIQATDGGRAQLRAPDAGDERPDRRPGDAHELVNTASERQPGDTLAALLNRLAD